MVTRLSGSDVQFGAPASSIPLQDLANARRRSLPDISRSGQDAVVHGKPHRSVTHDTYAPPQAGDETDAAGGGDSFVQEYVYFLASLNVDTQNSEDFSKEVQRIQGTLAQPQSGSTDRASPKVQAYSANSQSSLSAQLGVYFKSDGLSEELYLSAQATYKGSFSEQVTLSDGSTVQSEGTFEFNFSFEFYASRTQQAAAEQPQQADPLALDIDGDGEISLSSAQDGISFDINADGRSDTSAFVQGADVFLALDRNGNGSIDDGGELFGDQHGAANGYLELSGFDDDGNGAIDANDSIFQKLTGVRKGSNGALETLTLAQLHVASISLGNQVQEQVAQGGNRITQIGTYADTAGRQQRSADVLLNYIE